MPYPVGITTRAVTMGGATALESAEPLILQAIIQSSRGLIWGASGWRFPSLARTVTSTAGAEITVELPVTDLPGWRLIDAEGSILDVSVPGSYTHTYTVTLIALTAADKIVSQRILGPFVLPTGDGSPVDLDTLLPAGTVAGGAVLVPDTWGPLVVAAEAAAASAIQSAADPRLTSAYGRALQITQATPRFGVKNYGDTGDFYTLRSVYHVWDSVVKNTGAVYGLSVPSAAGLQSIFRTLDGGISWTKLGSVAVNLANNELLEHIYVEPYYETILVVKNMNTTLNNSYHLLTLDNTCALKATLDMGANRTWHGGMQNVDSVDKAGAWGTRIIMFSEYTNNNAVSGRIMKSEDKGLTWTVALEKGANNGVVNTGEIRHFHCVQVDPFAKHWWASAGDADAQCHIWRSTDEGATWNVIFSGDQDARTLGFVFEDGFLYYGMDSPHLGAQSKIYRVDKSTLARTEVGAVPDGLAIYMMTRTFYPAGFLVWTADELGTAESVGVYFFDYRTQGLTSIHEFAGGGIQEASRYQDRETGLVWVKPSSALFRDVYGYGGTSATLSEILKARMV